MIDRWSKSISAHLIDVIGNSVINQVQPKLIDNGHTANGLLRSDMMMMMMMMTKMMFKFWTPFCWFLCMFHNIYLFFVFLNGISAMYGYKSEK